VDCKRCLRCWYDLYILQPILLAVLVEWPASSVLDENLERAARKLVDTFAYQYWKLVLYIGELGHR
jgi:hypothetical protein